MIDRIPSSVLTACLQGVLDVDVLSWLWCVWLEGGSEVLRLGLEGVGGAYSPLTTRSAERRARSQESIYGDA